MRISDGSSDVCSSDLLDMGDVPYAKGDCISVELPVRKTQAFGVFLGPDKTFSHAFLPALHADAQHFRVDIRHGDRRPFQVPEKGNVTGAARSTVVSYVEIGGEWLGE